ncbi:MAG: 16S rRNA (uracil(1498)-N(3))-methyltransferase [Clostridia bacterium]|nr:16S rRNA (uracil(1498)-N(3))-methyltransferase [Clostridia bacterium]
MPRFFVSGFEGGTAVVTGEDARHIAKVLRMRIGEKLTLCDGRGEDCLCEITGVGEAVTLRVLSREPSKSEPTVRVTLFQALPKAEKMEFIVQKCTELGVCSIVPVLTQRCVSRPDGRALESKEARWRKIALEAAKQSGRGAVPAVLHTMDFDQALASLASMERAVMLYELGGIPFSQAISPDMREVGILIGPEGGFEESEAAAAKAAGISVAGLGLRILRTETAPLCALSVVMFATGNL